MNSSARRCNNAGVNITPATSFVVADPNSMVFSANVRQQDIDFISVGNTVNVSLDAMKGQSMQGVVDKIYPQKIVLLNGDQVYRVDIKVNNLPSSVQFGQSGTVLIKATLIKKLFLFHHGQFFLIRMFGFKQWETSS